MGNYCCFYVARNTAEYKAKSEFKKLGESESDPWNRALTNIVNKSQNLVVDGKRGYHKHETSKLIERNQKKSNEVREKYMSSSDKKISSEKKKVSSDSRTNYNNVRDKYRAQVNAK